MVFEGRHCAVHGPFAAGALRPQYTVVEDGPEEDKSVGVGAGRTGPQRRDTSHSRPEGSASGTLMARETSAAIVSGVRLPVLEEAEHVARGGRFQLADDTDGRFAGSMRCHHRATIPGHVGSTCVCLSMGPRSSPACRTAGSPRTAGFLLTHRLLLEPIAALYIHRAWILAKQGDWNVAQTWRNGTAVSGTGGPAASRCGSSGGRERPGSGLSVRDVTGAAAVPSTAAHEPCHQKPTATVPGTSTCTRAVASNSPDPPSPSRLHQPARPPQSPGSWPGRVGGDRNDRAREGLRSLKRLGWRVMLLRLAVQVGGTCSEAGGGRSQPGLERGTPERCHDGKYGSRANSCLGHRQVGAL